jgi:hypothetical protein
LRSAAICSGEPGKGSSAARARNCLVSSFAVIWLNQPASLSMIGRGVPAGTTTPHHGATSTPGTPASASVGISGIVEERLAAVTARMRTFGWLFAQVESTDMKSIWPESRLANASPVTLNGTYTVLSPVFALKSSAAIWPLFDWVP